MKNVLNIAYCVLLWRPALSRWLSSFSFVPLPFCPFTPNPQTLFNQNRHWQTNPRRTRQTTCPCLRDSASKTIKFLTILTLLILTGCGRSEEPAPLPILDGPLTINAPDTATVGQTLELTVGPADAPNGTLVHLTLLGSYGPQILRAEFQNGQAWFQIPSTMTTRSGTVDLIARSGNAYGEHTLELLPDEPVEPLTPLVGSRSIIADGNHWAMTVVIPFDQYGNPVAEGTPVEMRALHPGNYLIQYTPKVKHLLAWQRMYSRTTAGRTIITTKIDQIYGPESILTEIPGWPVPFTITADPPTLPADGFQLITLRTSIIHDQYDNILPDGTQITFIMTGADGRIRTIPAQIVDGVAETFIQTPLVSGDYQIQATILGMKSEPLTIEFTAGPAIGRFPLDFELDNSAGAVYITAGPIIGSLEQYVPDGTPVTFEITDENGDTQSATAYTDQGYATAELRRIQFDTGRYEINATAGAGTGRVAIIIRQD